MGVRTRLLQTGVVVYSTALAGLGGALYASLYSLEVSLGSSYILKGVEAAILAGIGSVMGSLVGGILLGVTEAVGSIYLPAGLSRRLRPGLPGVDPAASGRRASSGPGDEAGMKLAFAWLPLFARPARAAQRGCAHHPHLHLHPRHPRGELQSDLRLHRAAVDVPRRGFRHRGLRHAPLDGASRRVVLDRHGARGPRSSAPSRSSSARSAFASSSRSSISRS